MPVSRAPGAGRSPRTDACRQQRRRRGVREQGMHGRRQMRAAPSREDHCGRRWTSSRRHLRQRGIGRPSRGWGGLCPGALPLPVAHIYPRESGPGAMTGAMRRRAVCRIIQQRGTLSRCGAATTGLQRAVTHVHWCQAESAGPRRPGSAPLHLGRTSTVCSTATSDIVPLRRGRVQAA